jgi:hypothetical protein
MRLFVRLEYEKKSSASFGCYFIPVPKTFGSKNSVSKTNDAQFVFYELSTRLEFVTFSLLVTSPSSQCFLIERLAFFYLPCNFGGDILIDVKKINNFTVLFDSFFCFRIH